MILHSFQGSGFQESLNWLGLAQGHLKLRTTLAKAVSSAVCLGLESLLPSILLVILTILNSM
jgi:hypothetical protein